MIVSNHVIFLQVKTSLPPKPGLRFWPKINIDTNNIQITQTFPIMTTTTRQQDINYIQAYEFIINICQIYLKLVWIFKFHYRNLTLVLGTKTETWFRSQTSHNSTVHKIQDHTSQEFLGRVLARRLVGRHHTPSNLF